MYWFSLNVHYFLKEQRSSHRLHAEPSWLHRAQIGNLWCCVNKCLYYYDKSFLVYFSICLKKACSDLKKCTWQNFFAGICSTFGNIRAKYNFHKSKYLAILKLNCINNLIYCLHNNRHIISYIYEMLHIYIHFATYISQSKLKLIRIKFEFWKCKTDIKIIMSLKANNR